MLRISRGHCENPTWLLPYRSFREIARTEPPDIPPRGDRREDCQPDWNPPGSLHREASIPGAPMFPRPITAESLWPSTGPRHRTIPVRLRTQLRRLWDRRGMKSTVRSRSRRSAPTQRRPSRKTPSFNSMMRSGITRDRENVRGAVAAASLMNASSSRYIRGVGVPSRAPLCSLSAAKTAGGRGDRRSSRATQRVALHGTVPRGFNSPSIARGSPIMPKAIVASSRTARSDFECFDQGINDAWFANPTLADLMVRRHPAQGREPHGSARRNPYPSWSRAADRLRADRWPPTRSRLSRTHNLRRTRNSLIKTGIAFASRFSPTPPRRALFTAPS